MARFMKKAIAFVLVLTTIFMFSTVAFADYTEGTAICENYKVKKYLSGNNSEIIATMNIERLNGASFTNVTAEITVTCEYCPSDAIRPSNYFTDVETKTFDLNELGGNVALTIDDVPNNHVVISATATYSLTISGQEKGAGSLTIYPY